MQTKKRAGEASSSHSIASYSSSEVAIEFAV